jgi:hypothetical protein
MLEFKALRSYIQWNDVLGGLEPHFRVLFSAIFQGVTLGISIRVETCGSERKQKVWHFVVDLPTKFLCVVLGI